MRAIFLDRDGTLIVDVGYPRDPEEVELLDGAAGALRAFARDWLLVIASNQSGIGRGLISPEEANAVHDRVIERFGASGVAFAGAYYCPHLPETECACRKPKPGLLHDAARELGIQLHRSILIGDKPSDVAAGLAAGCAHAIRFGPDADKVAGSVACTDWAAVRRFVLSLG